MNLELINNKFKNRKVKPEGRYKEFSVLIPLINRNNELHLLFETRSENLNTQPGEICFPGGGIEAGEKPVEAAIRETQEELNIKKNNIKIIGAADYIVTPFNLILYPYVGILEDIQFENIDFNHDEVGDIFTVPLDFLIKTDPVSYYVNTKLEIPHDFPYHKIQNGKVYNWRTGKYSILFYEYNGYVIWGMTAKIIKNFIDIISI